MKDIKINNPVKPIVEPRTAQRAKASPQAGSGSFEATLESTVVRMNTVANQVKGLSGEASGKAASIREKADAVAENFNELMRVQQDLSKLYQRMQPKSSKET